MSDDQAPKQRTDPRQQATYLGLIALFLGLFAAFWQRERAAAETPRLSALDLATLGLATYRTGRIIAFDQVTSPLRAPFTEQRDGGTQPKGAGPRRAISELVACPTCIGTWIAALGFYGLKVAPRPTRAAVGIMAAGGVAELLDYATEALDKVGRAAEARTEE